jgi:hypothetical protein
MRMNKPPPGIRDGRRFRGEKPWKAGFPLEIGRAERWKDEQPSCDGSIAGTPPGHQP